MTSFQNLLEGYCTQTSADSYEEHEREGLVVKVRAMSERLVSGLEGVAEEEEEEEEEDPCRY